MMGDKMGYKVAFIDQLASMAENEAIWQAEHEEGQSYAKKIADAIEIEVYDQIENLEFECGVNDHSNRSLWVEGEVGRIAFTAEVVAEIDIIYSRGDYYTPSDQEVKLVGINLVNLYTESDENRDVLGSLDITEEDIQSKL